MSNVTDISDFPFVERNLTENRAIYIADTVGLIRKKRSKNLHRYEFEFVTRDMSPDTEGRGVKAKLSDACDGDLTWTDPVYSYTRGTEPSGGITLSDDFIKGEREITLTGGSNWQLLSGDYIQFDNDTKVYEVVNDTNLQSGEQTIRLTSPLRKSTPVNTNVTVNGVQWLLVSDGVIEIDTDANDNQDIQIQLNTVEKL